MSGARGLDAATAVWLATLDPALAHLSGSLPSPSEGLRLHEARWTPGEGCWLSYTRTVPGTTGFVGVDVTPEGWSRHDYRDDPRLPGLARATDPAAVAELLAPVLGERPATCRVEPVRFRPGSRCVLRYEVVTGAGTTRFYAKAVRPERFAGTAARTRLLSSSAAPRGLVPPLVGTWPDVHVLLTAAVDGRRVSAVLDDPRVPAPDRTGLARRAGELLAGLHCVPDVPAPAWTPQDQVTSVVTAMAAVRRVDPRLATRLLLCLEILGVDVPAPEVPVLSHGSFRAGQVVGTPQGPLVALDTDRLSRSPAARDLGSVLAHLTWQGVRRPQLRWLLKEAEDALLEGYRHRAGPVDPQSLAWWRAAGLLQLAVRRYRRLELGAWPAVPVVAEAVVDLLGVDRAGRSRDGALDVLDCGRMSHAIGRAVSPDAEGSRPVRVRSARVLAEAPGRRRVVRYDVDGLDGLDGLEGDATVPLIGKAFVEPARARLLHEHLTLLAQGPFREGPLRVPDPVALLHSRSMVLYRSVAGTPLDELHDPGSAAAGARAAARWLVRLHASSVHLPRRFSVEQEQQTTRRWATVIAGAVPEAAGPARRLAARWAVDAPGNGPLTPIHKDFHAGHVLVDDAAQVHVVDLDEARLGDPAFDVAHFCTYLDAVDPDGRAGDLQRAFLDEYAAAGGPADPGGHAAYAAYTWLKIARQVALGSGPFRNTCDAGRGPVVVSALSRGLACLDR